MIQPHLPFSVRWRDNEGELRTLAYRFATVQHAELAAQRLAQLMPEREFSVTQE